MCVAPTPSPKSRSLVEADGVLPPRERETQGGARYYLSWRGNNARWIKLLHTAIQMFFVAYILALPIGGIDREFRWAGALASLGLDECALLAVNRTAAR